MIWQTLDPVGELLQRVLNALRKTAMLHPSAVDRSRRTTSQSGQLGACDQILMISKIFLMVCARDGEWFVDLNVIVLYCYRVSHL